MKCLPTFLQRIFFSIMILYDEVEACYEPYRSHLVSYVSVLHSTATGLVQLLLGP